MAGTTTRTGPILAVLALGGASYALLQSLVAPALPTIQGDLHVSAPAAAWIFTAYLLSASVTTPVLGRLGDMLGKRRLLVASLGGLALGGLIAALASSLPLLIVARVIQGVGGAVFPLAFGIIRDEFPRERIAGGIALVSAIMGIGGGLGIVLAGPIVQHLSYHWLFWIPLVVVSIAAVAAVVVVPETPKHRLASSARVSWGGALLLSAWLVCLLLAVSEAPTWGWGAARTLGLFAAAAVLLVAWVAAEARSPHPLVDMTVMRLRGVWTTNAAALLLGFGMFAAFIIVPEFVEVPKESGFGFGASVTGAGLFLVPMTLAMLVTSPIAGRLSNSVGSRVPLVVGAFGSLVAFVILAAAHSHHWEVYVATAIMGAGIGFAFASMANLIVEAVPPDQTGVASGMNTIMRSIGGSIGGEIAASVIAANLLASGLPAERGFTLTFVICAGVVGAGLLAALAVPRPQAHVARFAAPAAGAGAE